MGCDCGRARRATSADSGLGCVAGTYIQLRKGFALYGVKGGHLHLSFLVVIPFLCYTSTFGPSSAFFDGEGPEYTSGLGGMIISPSLLGSNRTRFERKECSSFGQPSRVCILRALVEGFVFLLPMPHCKGHKNASGNP